MLVPIQKYLITVGVQRGLDGVGLEEWAKQSELEAMTRGYLDEEETQIALAECVKDLIQRPKPEGI